MFSSQFPADPPSRYKESGVDIQKGDAASAIAYAFAKKTFSNRKGRIGEPRNLEMGFSGLLDMGDFYLAFNSDGIGSKTKVAQATNIHHTLGYDLVAMVADDCVCVGAEPVALVNTLDMEKVEPSIVEKLMEGLEKAAAEAGIAVVGGEIAELRDQVRGYQWSASLMGVVEKEKVIDGSKIKTGDALVALLTDNFRSNGFSLVRHVLEGSLGPWWHKDKYDEKTTWGEKILAPSKIFSPFVLRLIGRYGESPRVEVHGIAHITGGGLKHNMERILPEGKHLNVFHLPPVPEVMVKVKEMGKISKQEAYQVWNMGIAMVLFSPEPQTILKMAEENGISAQVIGRVE
jgi:phosphoribosylformylglycinamidine cyclo-ligase